VCQYMEGRGVMVALKVNRNGNSLALTLTKEALALLNVSVGDTVYLTDALGGCRITSCDPTFARHMAVADEVMKRRRNALRELANR
jgi:putative addiction module antidote